MKAEVRYVEIARITETEPEVYRLGCEGCGEFYDGISSEDWRTLGRAAMDAKSHAVHTGHTVTISRREA